MGAHVKLAVRATESKGRGVFALVRIPAGTLIETSDVVLIPEPDMEALEDSILGNYFFRWGEGDKQGALALGYGSLYNHSYNPNARYVKHFENLTIDFIALQDIAEGEEIKTNYNGDPTSRKGLWFSVID
ncbi:MAG: SET domain-containing protein [Gammaproteobacteria bacterium]